MASTEYLVYSLGEFELTNEVKMPKTNLTTEFIRECAELVILHGYKQDDAAKAMSVSVSSIQR